ncbi:hypothetical protein IJ135_01985 [Candidatus Saccharibacteria bacterium]|nr:hypothetical protein [Candidatus Saccharibacteria bacterium]
MVKAVRRISYVDGAPKRVQDQADGEHIYTESATTGDRCLLFTCSDIS